MEFFDLIQKRYSVRQFKDADIPDEDIEKIIAAAGRAPSGKNRQNWHFVAVKNKQMLQSLADAVRSRMQEIADRLPPEKGEKFMKFSKFSTFFAEAPVVIFVYAGAYIPEGYPELVESKDAPLNIERLMMGNPGIQGVGGAIEHLILAAFNLGYGACWMTSPNNSAEALEKILGFQKDTYKLVATIPIGVPEGDSKSPAKLDIKEIMTLIK
jgi:nitroreductase